MSWFIISGRKSSPGSGTHTFLKSHDLTGGMFRWTWSISRAIALSEEDAIAVAMYLIDHYAEAGSDLEINILPDPGHQP